MPMAGHEDRGSEKSNIEVLRLPVETAQFTSTDLIKVLATRGIDWCHQSLPPRWRSGLHHLCQFADWTTPDASLTASHQAPLGHAGSMEWIAQSGLHAPS